MKRVRVGRERAALDLGDVLANRAADDLLQVVVALGELGSELVEKAEQVVKHEYLTVAVRAGADADGRDRRPLGDLGGQVERDPFEHERERARLFYRGGVFEQPLAPAGGMAM